MDIEARKRVAVVGGMRTPFVKAGTAFSDLSQLTLSSHAVRGLLDRFPVRAEDVDLLVWGRVLHDPRISNLAREIVFDLGLPPSIRAHLVSNNCITSIHAITDVADAIEQGRSDIGVAGGVESMSTVPVLFGQEAGAIFLRAGMAKSAGERFKSLLRLRPRHLFPEPLSFKEPSTGLTMGQHAEVTAKEWNASRREQDEIALASHHRAAAATVDGRLKAEIHPLRGIDQDTIVRGGTSLEKLAGLRPGFDRSEEGTITAGNSSPLTDGAAAVLLMSEERAAAEGLKPLAFVKAVEYAAIDPAEGLLMAPAVAVPRLLQRVGLTLDDMDIVEVHEAFGAQVACNLAAWEKGWKEPAIGGVDRERLNPLGSSIAVGHPFGATGARIVSTLAGEMARRGSRYGLVSVCAAGAMAAAMILESP
ncbi:MAG: acetyl-CoA C-acyltransferase [Desulfuromonas sp.]|uniref:acetyl-CoA C-acyltransferase n=1 Tax=Desulfuromonas sp. TaxID=892 RepID=UPI000CA6F1D9|nr:acetyl-CoA C-acyltransferase [Desulfuromonas sp.]PLX85158.1 MAG: acetyl-CoA C-acyltransferase [Desulfuromonas sp.]